MRLSVLFLFLFVLCPLAAWQQSRVSRGLGWQFAHPDACVLLGLDWKKALESPLGKLLAKHVHAGGHPLLGFVDSIDGVERLLISSAGAGPRKSLLVVAQGKFALSKIRTLAAADGAVSRRYNDVELLVPPNATPADIHFALLDVGNILFGDGASVKAAINRHLRGDEPNARNAVFVRARTLSNDNDFWLVAEEPSTSLEPLGMAALPLWQELVGLEMGVAFRDKATVELLMFAPSEEDARALHQGLAPALGVLVSETGNPVLARAVKGMRLSSERALVRLTATLDAPLLDRTFAALRASSAPPPRQVAAATAPSSPEGPSGPPPIPAKRVVRIIGEDGVREIPYPATGKR